MSETGDVAPAASPSPVGPPSAGGLIGSSLDLVVRRREDMRRASFYVGWVILGTVGPVVLASWTLQLASLGRPAGTTPGEEGVQTAIMGLLVVLAVAGVLAALIDSRTLAVGLLGASASGRPFDTREAITRSRQTFWGVVVATALVAVVSGLAQAIIGALLADGAMTASGIGAAVSVIVAILIGAPFAYALTGIVLGGVDPLEAIRRSGRLFRARRAAALVVAAAELTAVLLLFLGVSAGLDVAIRLAGALGLGPYASPVGLVLTTAGIVAVLFAFGTLLFTVMAISVAPGVVMFVGLTHTTIGLDAARAAMARSARPSARSGVVGWFGRPMMSGFVGGAIGLAIVVVAG